RWTAPTLDLPGRGAEGGGFDYDAYEPAIAGIGMLARGTPQPCGSVGVGTRPDCRGQHAHHGSGPGCECTERGVERDAQAESGADTFEIAEPTPSRSEHGLCCLRRSHV